MIALETIAYSLGVIAITFATVLFMMGGLSYARRHAQSDGTGTVHAHHRLPVGRRRKEREERGEREDREEPRRN
ncbi:hypothetical protein [Streptomyces odontomachi]|uniref:hypothetical protein n=1 Tax=Streptomyces odontomachi TaxID=2944940 RepID=UPI0021095990|nr:hypothetical protein [Streptomyces sp. ODS25]